MQDLKVRIALLSIAILTIMPNILFSQQAPGIEWQTCLGGTGGDEAYSMIQAQDHGFVIVGRTTSFTDVSLLHEEVDGWVVKINSSGQIEWQRCLGGSHDDILKSISLSSDGGYVVVGSTVSNDGDVSGKHGNNGFEDVWVVKLSSAGLIEWQKCLGGIAQDFGSSIIQTTDGGYAIAGNTGSIDGDVTRNHGDGDAWVIKLDSSGGIQWQKCLGGTLYDEASCIIQTTDGGYALAGSTYSNDGDVLGKHNGANADGWIVKMNSFGVIEWQKCIGGTWDDVLTSIAKTVDKGYIIVGTTRSMDGDVFGFHKDTTTNYRYDDAWIVKLDSSGIIEWQSCLGGTEEDIFTSVLQTPDTGFLAVGYTASTNGDVTKNQGLFDVWVVKVNASGKLEWQKSYGGSNPDEANSLIETFDGKYVFAGMTMSSDGDVSGLHLDVYKNGRDFWVVKLNSVSGVPTISFANQGLTFNIFPNPVSESGNFTFTVLKESTELEIFDLLGRSVFSQKLASGLTSLQVNMQNKTAGIYFARLGSQTVRFIKY